jgi:uncharacterized protein (UPF0332 family)
MKSSDIQALIAYRMEKSMEAIKAAEIMLENNMLTFAMNRIYYSMFYAVQSLLASDGVSFSKHGQVKGYFNRKWIKSGKLSKTLGQLYKRLNIAKNSITLISLLRSATWCLNISRMQMSFTMKSMRF